ncbi:MAG TPA: hypothetical protein VHO25_19320 [Polyangiaceae bacterium]|nr:hypothetical protein [Polyangiaceae bacterium]
MSRLRGKYLGILVVALVACVDAETAPSGPSPNVSSGGSTAVPVGGGVAGTGSSAAGAAPVEPVTCIDFVGSYRGSLACSDNSGGSIYATFTQEGCVLSGTNTEGAVETWSANGNIAVRYVNRAGWMGTCTLTVQGDTFSEYCNFTNQGSSANCTWSGAIIRPQGTGGSGGSAGTGGASGGAAGASGAGGATGGAGAGGMGGTPAPPCDNMCDSSLDGTCDYPDLCAPGTDCTDCGM